MSDSPVTNASDQDAVARGCYFDESHAERVRQFFRQFLRHSKGEWAGRHFELLPWQWERLIRPLFGWRRADGLRRFRRVYIEIPKKNGKSTLCAGLALYLMLADDEPGAEVYSAAADRRQAGIVFGEVVQMAKRSAALEKRIKMQVSQKRMAGPGGSLYEALSADVPTKEGLNIHGLIFDELHAQKSRKLFETLEYGGAARRQPMLISITTAGDNKDSICWEQHEYARCVIEGKHIDPSFFGLIFAADQADDWKSPDVWRRANPSLGTALKEDQFADDCKAAQMSPARETSFKRYRLNIWSEGSAAQWLPVDLWDACRDVVDAEALRGKVCHAGLDLSATTDLTAFVLWFPETRQLVPYFWLPTEACRERERLNKARLDQWIRSGHIRAIEGAYIQQDVLIRDIEELARKYRIKDISIDPWNGYDMAVRLRNKGLNPVIFKQGYQSISAPMKRLGEMVLAKEIRHDGHPVMRWCLGNTAVTTDAAENIKPTKAKSRDRIDGVVALIMAIGSAPVQAKSVWERRGLLD